MKKSKLKGSKLPRSIRLGDSDRPGDPVSLSAEVVRFWEEEEDGAVVSLRLEDGVCDVEIWLGKKGIGKLSQWLVKVSKCVGVILVLGLVSGCAVQVRYYAAPSELMDVSGDDCGYWGQHGEYFYRSCKDL